jgi:hypothetical protein
MLIKAKSVVLQLLLTFVRRKKKLKKDWPIVLTIQVGIAACAVGN